MTLNHQVEGSIPSRCILALVSVGMRETITLTDTYATVAQLVERQPEELGVGGSTPSGGTEY